MTIYRACTRGVLLTLIGGAATVAAAQSVNISGSADGFFNGGPSTTYGGLTYLGSTFNVNSADGFYALGGNAGSPNLNNLGSFSLDSTVFNYSSPATTFTLDVDFTTPTGISGGQTTSFIGSLTGSVSSSSSGGVQITFPSGANSFAFSNSSGTGTFTLAVNSLALHPGQSDALTGQGTAKMQSVPEPPQILGMTMGIAGLGLRLLKKGSRRARP